MEAHAGKAAATALTKVINLTLSHSLAFQRNAGSLLYMNGALRSLRRMGYNAVRPGKDHPSISQGS